MANKGALVAGFFGCAASLTHAYVSRGAAEARCEAQREELQRLKGECEALRERGDQLQRDVDDAAALREKQASELAGLKCELESSRDQCSELEKYKQGGDSALPFSVTMTDLMNVKVNK